MLTLVTGGAGFIGSHLADRLLTDGHDVRILDDLSTGSAENVPARAQFLKGDITDSGLVDEAVADVEVVFHQAARGSVARSLDTPLVTDHVNIAGTLTVLDAARRAGVRRMVAASSSSVYGGVAPRPTTEAAALTPKSPYAVTKMAGEHYLRVYAELYDIETVSLRYFNVYGPRQRPDSAYAAVIPRFVSALRNGQRPQVHGDGLQSRDFAFVEDVVTANLRAGAAPADRCSGRAYNVAGGQAHSLLDLLAILGEILGVEADPEHVEPRPGDVRHSAADLTAAATDLGYRPTVDFAAGLEQTVSWFR